MGADPSVLLHSKAEKPTSACHSQQMSWLALESVLATGPCISQEVCALLPPYPASASPKVVFADLLSQCGIVCINPMFLVFLKIQNESSWHHKQKAYRRKRHQKTDSMEEVESKPGRKEWAGERSATRTIMITHSLFSPGAWTRVPPLQLLPRVTE